MWHLVLNWRPLKVYFRRAFSFRGGRLGEFLPPLLVTLFFWWRPLAGIPPASWIPQGHRWFEKEVWKAWGLPPVPWDGAEKTPLGLLAGAYGIDYAEFRKKVDAAGLPLRSPRESLRELAGRFGLSPAEALLKALGPKKGMGPKELLKERSLRVKAPGSASRRKR